MKKIDFNHGWVFTQEGTERRTEVTLPHDAMINTERNPNMRNYFLLAGFEGGKYIYTKRFFVSKEEEGKTYLLEFEAVYCMSEVYVNGQLAAKKAYGFIPFQIHLNPYLKFGAENEIRVEANVPREGHGRWYTGGGIYRPVNLYIGEDYYIEPYGVKVTTLSINPAKIQVDVRVNGGKSVCVDILKNGRSVIFTELAVTRGHSMTELVIPDARLWSAETPELYEAVVSLKQGEHFCDTVTETFGIRTIEVNAEKGLLINGVPTFLRGGCIHNDCGVIGVINNDSTEIHRARKLKKSGFNALRSAHHPMSRSLMKACDEVGLYVMDEAFDYWYRPKGGNPHCAQFMDTFKEDTIAMVQDAYNHPCVIMYSIGNEIPEAGSLKGVRVGKAIVDAIHSIDITRPTTLCPSVHWLREYLDGVPYLTEDEDEWMAKATENKETDWKHYMKIFMGAAANIPENEKDMAYPPTFVQMDEDATKNLYPYLDVAGYNYYEDKYDTLHELHPERVLLGTETRGEMIVDTMRYARSHPFLIGDFIWTLQEHLGEANCCNISYGEQKEKKDNLSGKDYPWLINYGGTIDLIGTILPSIHKYEFAWDENKKGLYLASQPPIHQGLAPNVGGYRWTDTVEGWTYEGYEGQPTWVDAYTDAASVEIFVNGKSVGKSDVRDYFAKVPCTYEPGELMGIGYDESGRELYRTVVRSANRDTRITAIPEKTTLQAGEEDFCFIDVSITDYEGTLKLLPERVVNIKVEGPGTLQGFGSANHLNEEKYDQLHHTTYLGRLQAVIRSGKEGGEVKITFFGDGMESAVVTLTVE